MPYESKKQSAFLEYLRSQGKLGKEEHMFEGGEVDLDDQFPQDHDLEDVPEGEDPNPGSPDPEFIRRIKKRMYR